MHHYNFSRDDAEESIGKMSRRLRKAGDVNAKWLFDTYKKHEQFWMDKGQDIILEYDPEAHGTRPRIPIRNLEVPIELRTLLDLKHSHITLNSEDAGRLIEIFEQDPNSEKEQPSSKGQRTDARPQEHLSK